MRRVGMRRICQDMDKIHLDYETAIAQCGVRARCVLATTACHGLEWPAIQSDEERWAKVADISPPSLGWDEGSVFYRLMSEKFAEHLYPKDWSRRQQATQKSTSQPSSQGGGVAVILEASSLETVGGVVEVDWGGGGGLFLGQERRGEESLAYTGGYIGGI